MSPDQQRALEEKAKAQIIAWRDDWNKFISDVFGVRLDKEQQAIVTSVQRNRRTTVASGTARGKDFVAANVALSFLYLTPRFQGTELIENTKVAMTAPTDRQVGNIMVPEIVRLFNKAKSRGVHLPGRATGYDIRTDFKEWFLTGFKADQHNHEAWSGFHAVNTMFIVTEASGLPQLVFDAIEGNLQGNSRILIVFNPNTTVGYAAATQKRDNWNKFRLNSLNAENVVRKERVIPGQVDYDWIKDKLPEWAEEIPQSRFDESEDDFEFDGKLWRPTDICRIKILGKFPKVSDSVLIPPTWIEAAQQRWAEFHKNNIVPSYSSNLTLGVDIGGMGRDNTSKCYRYDNIVSKFDVSNSGGIANHMNHAGQIVSIIDNFPQAVAMIDTIGEGAGVISRLIELGYAGRDAVRKWGFDRALSCKFSEAAKDANGKDMTDVTGQYKMLNMRSFCYWAVRDWLDPRRNTGAMLPPGEKIVEQFSSILWFFNSQGKVQVEAKEDIIERLGYSPDEADSLALTFWPTKGHKKSVKLNKAVLGIRH